MAATTITGEEFTQAMDAAGMTPTQFKNLVEGLSGLKLDPNRLSAWRKEGLKNTTPGVTCAMALLVIKAKLPPQVIDQLLPGH